MVLQEVHFFDSQYKQLSRRHMSATNVTSKLLQEYSTYFRPAHADMPSFISAEGTPSYFSMALQAPLRVKSLLPGVKLVVALRHPVHRTVSHFVGRRQMEFKKFGSCGEWFREFTAQPNSCAAIRPARIHTPGALSSAAANATKQPKPSRAQWVEQWDRYR